MGGVLPEYTRAGIAVDYANIIHCIKGEALISVNFKPVEEKAGTVVFLFPGDVVKVEKASADFDLEYLVFSEDILKAAAANMETLLFDVIHSHNHTDNPYAAEVVGQIIETARTLNLPQGGLYARETASALIRSLLLCYNNYLSVNGIRFTHISSRTEELFSVFMFHLARHFKESRDVTFYAEKMNITAKYLSNITLAKTGKTAKTAIDEYVIMQLRSVLQSTDCPVKEIAWDFHFSSTAFFCDYFKRHTGMTPLDYRQANNN